MHEKNYSKIKLKNYIFELKNWIKESDCIFKKAILCFIKRYLLKLSLKYLLKRLLKL